MPDFSLRSRLCLPIHDHNPLGFLVPRGNNDLKRADHRPGTRHRMKIFAFLLVYHNYYETADFYVFIENVKA